MTSLHTGASPRLRGSKRLAALLLLPLALLLSACHVNSAITVTPAGGVDLAIEVTGDKGSMNLSSVSCAAYGSYMRNFPNLQVQDSTNDLSNDILCSISGFTENGVDGKLLIDNDSTYILRIPIEAILKDHSNPHSSVTYSLTVHMPGEVVSATEGGTISGSDVYYEGRIADLEGDIEIEANKDDSSPAFLWVLGFLVVLLVAVVLASRYLRKKDPSQNSSPLKFFGKKEDKSAEKSRETAAEKSKPSGVSASTTDSTVTLAPLPDKYAPKNMDGTSESYSEQIGMVDPVIQGSEAEAVKRDIVLPEIPPETAFTSPIPGMPPRIPMSDELLASFMHDEVVEVADSDKPEPESESDALAFFSSMLEVTDDEGIDEETDL